MSDTLYLPLRRNISLLGRLLGEVIAEAEGKGVFDAVEQIRQLSKSARANQSTDELADYSHLQEVLANLDEEKLLPVARAFSQFLALANIAEQRHAVSRAMDEEFSATRELADVLAHLQSQSQSDADIIEAVGQLSIDLVLTAHPTEIARRTLINKYEEIDLCLDQLELQGRTERETATITNRLRELIAQIWHSQDFREHRPTPIDEAKSGFAVVEKSLWNAVPQYLRRLDAALRSATGNPLPIVASPIAFSSWMGGDRDGNPNVTAKVTREVLLLSRWQAADLYYRDLDRLVDELSMTRCSDSFRAQLEHNEREPYRAVLRPLRQKLENTLAAIEVQLGGGTVNESELIINVEQLWQPLHSCYQSLNECGMTSIANSALLDTLRRIRCFGLHLVRHDIRQESSVHTDLLSELTQTLDIGDYSEWNEAQRLEFLGKELRSRRPLIPDNWQAEPASKELLDTCRLVANQSSEALGAYVISMASSASDVLAVELLLKACGSPFQLPVVPLFETLDDLENAEQVVRQLLSDSWYREKINHRMMVMIGYSDSAKDAGVMAAAWAQYRAQEKLLEVCEEFGVELTLFHGRGGTIGRGGAPAHSALLSQPPGSLRGGLRVTEQGEMIRTKLGVSSIAVKTLALYTSAILKANLLEPPKPEASWRTLMDDMADASCKHYREIVRGHPNFVSYFRQATPEQELGSLPIGSRPSRRKADNSIKSLRAIPWIFAWSQNRLVLPAWLGAGRAMAKAIDSGHGELLRTMRDQWPFFATRLSMLEMVFAKSDAGLSAYYDKRLVEEANRSIGEQLRQQLASDTDVVLRLAEHDSLLIDQPWALTTIGLRNVYTDPLNVLQVELLQRNREAPDAVLAQGIMVTIAGIAAGLRNTG
ncbi:MAG: phosphoenolpyruvate carboxylase [Pseudomonadales bacterium]